MFRTTAIMAPALLLAGCGQDRDREVASGSFDDGNGGTGSYSVKSDGEQARVDIETGQGDVTIRTNAEGAALPGGFPLYPGAKVVSNASMSGDGGAGSGGLAAMQSADPPAKVIAFYRAAATRAGYTIENELNSSGSSMIGGPGKGGNFSVTVSPQEGGSGIMLLVGTGG